MTKTLRLLAKKSLLLLAFFAVHSAFATIRYVNAGLTTGSNNGTSWANSYRDLQAALAAAQSGDQIWVAKGTYYPTTSTTDRTASFVMKNNVAIYGGFAGSESVLSLRNWTTNVTTLSGDIDHATDPLVVTGSGATLSITGNAGNSYNVFYNKNNGLDKTAILDGFVIFGGGSVNNSYPDNIGNGGGMYNFSSSPTSPTLTNLIFLNNSVKYYGAAMFNEACSPILTNVLFLNNYSSGSGGAIYYAGSYYSGIPISSLNLTNCQFIGNFAFFGGGIYNYSYTSGNMYNCLFSTNYAVFSGGGMYNSGTSINVVNTVLLNNKAGFLGGNIDNLSSIASPKFTNCIVWSIPNTYGIYDNIYNENGSTPIVSYSDIQDGYTGTGNINQDPLFVNATNPAGADGIFGTADDGLALQPTSPCINTGSNAALPIGDTTDITGAARIQQGVVDMGAYENISCLSSTRLYVNAAATTNGDGSSWTNAYQYLTDAIHAANVCSNVQEIWVAKGTYYPTANSADRSASFFFKNNLAVYGGFAGTETTLSQRDWKNNATILSGDIDHTTDPLVVAGSGNTLNITGNAGNSFHVVFGNNLDKTSILDGFTITGGNASGTGGTYTGPITTGSVSPPQLYVVGGGLFNNNSSPTFGNLIFSGNYGFYGGGLVNINNSLPSLANVVFSKNKTFNYGGGLYNYNHSSPSLVNVLFSGNNCSAGTGGGGMYNDNSSPTLTNASFSGNYALVGADIYNDATAAPAITNSIIWGNPTGIFNSNTSSITITYSNIQGGYTGTGNINQDPLFVNASNPAGADGIFGTADDGLALQPTSPSINKGSNAALPIGITTDITGLPRIQAGTVDMGVYESNYIIPTAFTGCPNINLAIARPGYNTYKGEPVTIYNVDTTTGAATAIAGGPLKDPYTGANMDVNGAGLNSQDGFLYAMKDTGSLLASKAILYRIGANYTALPIGTIAPPSANGAINPAAGTFDDAGNYYVTGAVATGGGTNGPYVLYLGKITGLASLAPSTTSTITPTWLQIGLGSLACGKFLNDIFGTFGPSATSDGIQDITYSNTDHKIYMYTIFNTGYYRGTMISFDPVTGVANCFTNGSTIPFAPGSATNEVSGMASTANGSLLILLTGGDIYKAVLNSSGSLDGTLIKIGTSGIASVPGQPGSIRGDLASCGFGKALPQVINPSLTQGVVAFPNPVRGMATIVTTSTLNNATITLIGLAGNIISTRTGVSGNTFPTRYDQRRKWYLFGGNKPEW